jgi:flagellar motor switch protein FliM
MAASQTDSVKRRLTGTSRAQPPEPGITPARAVRIAMIRAAARAAGLSLTVLGIAEEVADLDEVLPALIPGDLILSTLRAGRPVGLATLDLELRTALIEAQTMGRLRGQPAEARPVTATDVALAQPLVAALLAELEHAAESGSLGDWPGGQAIGPRWAEARQAEAALPAGRYRVIRMTLDFGVGTRQGALVLALACPVAAPAGPDPVRPGFAEQLRARVLESEAPLTAVLHRMTMPLDRVEGLRIGDVLALPGASLGDVRLFATGGQTVATGRLGQTAGLRAVRVSDVSARPFAILSDPARPAIAGQGPATGAPGLPAPVRSRDDRT